MLKILAITGPIYCAIAVGYLAVRLRAFSSPDMRVLGRFVVNVALPAMMMNAALRQHILQTFSPVYVLAYGAGSLAVYAAGLAMTRWVAQRKVMPSVFSAAGMSCSNSAFIGYPLLLQIAPAVAATALALNMVVENMIVLPLIIFMAEQARGGAHGWRTTLLLAGRRTLTNPMVIGLAAGLAASALGLHLPEIADKTLTIFTSASAALSLFVVGGTLAGLSVKGVFTRIAPIAFGKLVVHPLAVAIILVAAAHVFSATLAPTLRTSAVVMAAAPMMSMYPILAQAYGEEDDSAAALLLTTVASFFTLSALIWALQAGVLTA